MDKTSRPSAAEPAVEAAEPAGEAAESADAAAESADAAQAPEADVTKGGFAGAPERASKAAGLQQSGSS